MATWVKWDLGERLRSPHIKIRYLCLGGSGGLGFAKWNPCSNCFRFADFVQTCHLAAAVTHCGNGDHTLAFHKYFISHCHANVGSNSPGEKSLCRRHEPASKINSG